MDMGVGVMIMTHRKFVSTHEPALDSDCEIVWNKIVLTGSHPLYTVLFTTHQIVANLHSNN